MKKHLLSFILLALVALSQTLPAKAEFTKSYTSGGIYYMLDTKAKTAQIVYNDAHKNLTTLDLPSLVVYNSDSYDIVSIGTKAFMGCTKLTSATIPFKVTDVDVNAFSGCSSLTKMVFNGAVSPGGGFLIPLRNTLTEFELGAMYSGSTSIGTWFKGSTSLKKFTSRNKTTSIAAEAFSGCTALESFSCYTIETIGNKAFQDCSNLTSAFFGTDLTTIGDYAFQSCTKLPRFTFYASVTSIGDFAFQYCKSLQKADLSKTKIEEVGPYTFGECPALESVTLPNTVKIIYSYAFRDDKMLASCNIPSSVTSLGSNIWEDCESLESLVVPSSVTTITGTSNTPFANITGLKSIDFSQSKLKNIHLSGCTSLETVNLPVAYNGTVSFRNCSSLQSIDLRNTNITNIGENCFLNCTNLKNIYLPSTVTSIGRYAFSGTAITSLSWPSTINIIPNYCFLNCGSLSSFTIPSNVTKIGDYAFNGCNALRNVYTEASYAPTLGTDAFKSTIPVSSRLLVVSSSSYNSYANAGYGKYFTLAMPTATSVSFSYTELTLYANTTGKQLTATVLPSTASQSVTFSSSNPAVASVSGTGYVTPHKTGTAIITATTPNGLSATCTVTVKDVTSVSLSETETTIMLPGTLQLSATILPAEASKETTWTSSNPAVATVSENGLVTTLAAGTTTITVTTGNGLTATCKIIVEEPVVKMDYNSLLLKPGVSQTINASFAGGVTWKSDDTTIATVDQTGKITAVSEGTVVITAVGKTNTMAQGKCVVTVSNENFIYVGNIYYLPIENEPGHLQVTNMGLGKASSYAADAERSEYSATVNIPATLSYDGIDYTVTQIGQYAFYRMKDLQMVVMPTTVQSINEHAFERSEKMVRVTFTNGSELQTIKTSAFKGCSKLNFVVLPNTVKTVEASAFMDCTSLSMLTLSTGMTEISPYLCYNCDVLDNLTLPAGIKTIGNSAFRYCENLQNITYPANLSMIDEYAFANCNALQTVSLPTKVAAIQNYAYYDNPQLKSITTPASLEGIGAYCFASNPKLETVGFSFTKPITIGEGAFLDCEALKTVNIKNAEAWVQTNFGNPIANPTYYSKSLSLNGTALTTLTLGTSAKYINQYALVNCQSITSVTIPSSVTAVSDRIFQGCTALKTVKIDATVPPLFVGTRNIGNSAAELQAIALTVPTASAQAYQNDNYWGLYSSVNGQPSTKEMPAKTNVIEFARHNMLLRSGESLEARIIGENSDANISWKSSNPSVASVNADGKITASMEGAAVITASLTGNSDVKGKILVQVSNIQPAYVGNIYYNIDNDNTVASVTNMGGANATSYPFDTDRYEYSGIVELPSSVTYAGNKVSINAIDNYAFYEMADLQKTIIPAIVERIGTRAFEEASEMKRVEFGQNSKLTSMLERAFYNCKKLDYVSLPSGLHTIDKSVFRYCDALQNITLPTALSMIDEYAFANCKTLQNINLPATLNSIQNYGFAFNAQLQGITIPESLIGIGAYCFRDCESLESIHFTNKRSMTIGESAFFNCNALKSTYVDNIDKYVETNFLNEMANPTYFSKSIGQNGKELKDVVVPATANYVNMYALINCKSITSVNLPASIQTVSDHIFVGCDNLTSVTCNATVPPAFIGTDEVTRMQSVFDRATLYVPSGSINYYKADDYWQNYKSISAITNKVTGDVNLDGKVNSTDIVAIYNRIQLGDSSGTSLENADVNNDGKVNSADVVAVYNLIIGGGK